MRAARLASFSLLLLAWNGFAQPLRITNVSHESTAFGFSFRAASNRNYMVNWSTLAGNVWHTLTNIQGNGSMAQIRDPLTQARVRLYEVFSEAPLRYLTIGHVGPTSARLAVGLDGPRDLQIIYSTQPNLASAVLVGPFPVAASDDYTRVIDLTGLSPNTTYFFTLLIDGEPYYSDPAASFRTAPPLGTPGTVRFAFGSCYNGTSAGGYGTIAARGTREARLIWQSINGKNPDFFLHLGDTAYCDNKAASDLNSYRIVHRHALDERLANMASYAFFRRHFPFYSIWDDHELANDWPWSPLAQGPWNPAYYSDGKQAFREYHARANPDPIVAGELYYTLQFRDIGFFMTDTRSFRSCQQGDDSIADISSGPVTLTFNGQVATASGAGWNNGLGFTPGFIGRTLRLSDGQTRHIFFHYSPTQVAVFPPGPPGTFTFTILGKTILGNAQKQHLKDWLLQNNDRLRFKFIATATPIHGLSEHVTAKDAWGAGYQAELNEIFDFAISNEIRNVVFLSGDQHWAGSFNRRRAGVNFFEFMSSPLSSNYYLKYSGSDELLFSRINWMFDVRMNPFGGENFGLVTVRTDISPATVKFELFDFAGALLNSTTLRETPSGLDLAP